MNIIFLDIDGVLNNTHTITNTPDILDELCVIRLHKILKYTNARIVISSSWRERSDSHIKLLYETFSKCGINPNVVISKTPSLSGQSRGDEIREWLANNRNVKNWIAIDDMKLDLENFIQIDYNYGLTDNDVEKVVGFFG